MYLIFISIILITITLFAMHQYNAYQSLKLIKELKRNEEKIKYKTEQRTKRAEKIEYDAEQRRKRAETRVDFADVTKQELIILQKMLSDLKHSQSSHARMLKNEISDLLDTRHYFLEGTDVKHLNNDLDKVRRSSNILMNLSLNTPKMPLRSYVKLSQNSQSLQKGYAVTRLLSTTDISQSISNGMVSESYKTYAIIGAAFGISLIALSLTSLVFVNNSSKANIIFPTILWLFVSFTAISTCFHYICYCFGGLIQTRFPKLWPKGIDYFYYIFGGGLLAFLAINGSIDSITSSIYVRGEVLIGIIILNLKLLKTSIDIYPKLFANDKNWIRTPRPIGFKFL